MLPVNHSGVLWLTGLSGSGKSTLATAAANRLRQEGLNVVIVDGDALRSGQNSDLGFTLADRSEHARRASELALRLADEGSLVIVALISPLRADRAASASRVRARGLPFAEIFVNAPLAECERRDPKKLYQRARAGQVTLFTGIDSPYEAPAEPDLDIHTDLETEAESAEKLSAFALRLLRDRANLVKGK
jgi:adenylyl-sulfate kinase